MHEFNVGDWVYAHDWCHGQIIDLDDESADVEFETPGGGGCFSFDITDLRKAPIPESEKKCDIRDNLLITAGARAGYMDSEGLIDLPRGEWGENRLVEFIVETVGAYRKIVDDISFDLFIEEALIDEFG